MAQAGLAARKAALDLLDAVTEEKRLLPEVLEPVTADLSVAERARAQRLALETLRNLQRADRLLGPHLRKKPWPRVHNMLRLGTVEMRASQAPAHAVVDAAVRILKMEKKTSSQAGLANAVLRRVAAAKADWAALPVPEMPKWLRKRLVAAWGKAAVAAMEEVQAADPPVDLSAKGDPAALAEAVGGTLLPTGTVRLEGRVHVSALPGFEAGHWWVQDAAAALPARALGAQPGERVLDLCAAPGGKTMQLAATGAAVTALDSSDTRMERVHENLARTGLRAEIVVADALKWQAEPFDAILLDAPCSATGTLRRHPDLPHAKDGTEVEALVALQARMIDAGLRLLKPGGRMVFCTCSLLPEEGEGQVSGALGRHPELRLDPEAFGLPGVNRGWVDPAHGLRLRPDFWADRGGMDGFFAAVFRKIG
ncbi:MAG: transcription antitermination factor NusB [Pseudomonadota bacterium]